MRIGWLITTQIALVLATSGVVAAQENVEAQERRGQERRGLGRALGDAVAGDPRGLGRVLGTPARSQSGPDETPAPGEAPTWAFDLGAQLSFPLSVGVEGTLVTPVGLMFQLGVGHTPGAFLDAMAGAIGGAGAYPARMDPLIDDAVGNGGWNVRASVGFTAFDGLELALGYTFLTASTGLRPSSIDAALNQSIPWPAGMERVPLSLNLHALHARVGWRFVIEERLVVRVAIGWTHTVAAEARVDVPPAMRMPPDDPATRMERATAEGLGKYGFTPELLLGVGYRF